MSYALPHLGCVFFGADVLLFRDAGLESKGARIAGAWEGVSIFGLEGLGFIRFRVEGLRVWGLGCRV